MREEWRNWAGNEKCRPAGWFEPGTTDELRSVLEKAERDRRTVRVVGTGHSFTDAALTEDFMLSLHRFDRVLDVDQEGRTVRVGAGITLHRLNDVLAGHDLAFENLGDIDVQSLAGATATGTHGTGARLRNLSSNLESVELMTAEGDLVELSPGSDEQAWRAARVSIGALGIITAITLRAVPAFTLRGVDRPMALDEVTQRLDELVESNDHFEFYMFPHSRSAQTRTNNRTSDPARPRPPAVAWMNEELLANDVFGLVCRFGRRFPRSIPTLNRIVARAWGNSTRVERSDRIFASSRRVRFMEMEYALPREAAREVIPAIHAISERKDLNVSFPIEVRFSAADDALLSPASGRDSCYIAVHVFQGMEWSRYFRAVEEVMDGCEGRPHWGKYHFQTAETLASRYPGWEAFARVRDRLDPERRFTNDYVRRVLGT